MKNIFLPLLACALLKSGLALAVDCNQASGRDVLAYCKATYHTDGQVADGGGWVSRKNGDSKSFTIYKDAPHTSILFKSDIYRNPQAQFTSDSPDGRTVKLSMTNSISTAGRPKERLLSGFGKSVCISDSVDAFSDWGTNSDTLMSVCCETRCY